MSKRKKDEQSPFFFCYIKLFEKKVFRELQIKQTMRARDTFFRNGSEVFNPETGSAAEEGYSPLYLNTQDFLPRYQPASWVSLSALVDEERRSDGRLMTNLDEDEPHTPFEATTTTTTNAAQDISHLLKRKLYLLMEDPSSSHGAFWVNVVVSVLIVVSAIMTTVETIPAFRSSESNQVW